MNADTRNYITNFMKALETEIQYIKNKGRDIKIELFFGQLINQLDKQFIYIFKLENDFVLPDGSPIELSVSPNTVAGQVVQIKEQEIILSVDRYLGERIPEAILIVKPYRLLELLWKQYEEILQNGSPHHTFDTGQTLFSPSYQNEGGTNIPVPPIKGAGKVNEEQTEALRKAVNERICFIWGPPGTGKSTTLGAITQFLGGQQKKKILVLSHTNAALDSLVQKIVEKWEGNSDDGDIIRIGIPSVDAKPFYEKHGVLLEQVIQKRGLHLREERDIIQSKVQDFTAQRDTLYIYIQKENEYRSLSLQLDLDRNLLNQEQSQLSYIQQRLNKLQLQHEDKETELKHVENSNIIIKMLKLKNLKKQVENLQNQIIKTQQEATAKESIIERLSSQLTIHEKRLKELEKEMDLTPKPYPTETSTEYLSYLDNALAALKLRLEELNNQLEQLETTILNEASVICATLTQSYLNTKILRTYDVVIIDEGSMAPLPVVFYAASLSREKVIVGGDFRQLSPIAQSPAKIVQDWLKRDIFVQSGIVRNGQPNLKDNRLVMLKWQFRAHPDIAEIYSKVVYEGKLKSGRNEHDFPHVHMWPSEGSPIVLIDTSDIDPWCSRTSTGSKYNIYHAILIGAMLKQMGEIAEEATVGVISPYAAQAKLLNKVVKDLEIPNLKIDASTVHKFQGSERDVVILDLTEGAPQHIGKFISQGQNSESLRLLNVGISRAKSKLIVVANLKHLEGNLPPNAILREFIEQIKYRCVLFESKQIITLEEVSFSSLFRKYAPVEQWLYDEREYFDALCLDLDSAKKSIIIYSPFLTTKQFQNFIPYLEIRSKMGVEVIVVTLPSWWHQQTHMRSNAEQVIMDLQRRKIKVAFKPNMHEKLVIIDNQILWLGSLNWLSHRNTSEQIVRIKLDRAVEEIHKLIELNAVLRQETQTIKREELPKYLLNYFQSTLYYDCDLCGLPMVCIMGAFGPFFVCTDESCGGKKNIPVRAIQAIIDRTGVTCRCGGVLEHKTFQSGAFIVCSKKCNERKIFYKAKSYNIDAKIT